MQYSRPPLSIDNQVDLLVRRGMGISNRHKAGHCLAHIGYYRLRGYWVPFEQGGVGAEHQFVHGTDFHDVISLYTFDRRFRLLLMDAIERVEVSLRTQWSHQLAMRQGAHCYMNADLFAAGDKYKRCLDDLKQETARSHETFIKHYRKTYTQPVLPPIWAVCEVMSLGQLSRWIGNLQRRADRQAIADVYDLDEVVLCSFLHHLTHIRNLCAHHSRVWNRRLTFTMKIPRHPHELRARFNPQTPRNIHNTLTMLEYLLRRISPDARWRRHLLGLLALHPLASLTAMGFPDDWQERTPWRDVV